MYPKIIIYSLNLLLLRKELTNNEQTIITKKYVNLYIYMYMYYSIKIINIRLLL